MNVEDLTGSNDGYSFRQPRKKSDQEFQLQPPWKKDHNPESTLRKCLLELKVLVGRDEHLEPGCLRPSQELAIHDPHPALRANGRDVVPRDQRREAYVDAFVEKHATTWPGVAHAALGIWLQSACAASSRNPTTCSRVTLG